MMGQFDEFWETMRTPDGNESWHRAQGYIARFRDADPAGNLGAFVVEPGTGHFPWSDANATLLAQWIRSVAARRIPADGGPLVPLSATSGWLLGFDLRTPTVTPWTEWQGDLTKTLWLPDEATARLAAAYHADLGKGLKDQFISWKDGTWVDAGVRHFFTKPTWVEGGATVRTSPAFRSTIPGRHDNKGPNWPGAGEPATDGGTPITVAIVAGAAVAGPGPTDVTMALNPIYDDPSARITFIARAPAGNGHRATEQVGMMPRGFKGLTGGAEQTLSFTAPESWSAAAGPLALGATSSQGLPVAYHVAYGPGRIVDGALVVDQIPARAALPMELVVVASQMGRATPNPVRMAAPVARTIRITR
jgi:hypothetical protein